MKNNTAQSKSMLEHALKALPEDFVLSEARSLMKAALYSLQKVEARRESKEKLQQEIQRQEDEKREIMKAIGLPTAGYTMTAREAQMAIMTLDKMIAKERSTIEKLHALKAAGGNDPDTKLQVLHS